MSENMNHHDHKETASLEAGIVAAPVAEKDPNYWRTLEQWANDPEFQKMATTEFSSSPLRDADLTDSDKDGGFARREFLKLMGASLAMATAGCIRRPVQKNSNVFFK